MSATFLQDLPRLRVCTVFTFQRLIQHLFVSNILQGLPWLLRSAMYSSFQRIIQHLLVSNISTRLAMTVGVCTVFILPKTSSTSVCHQHFHNTCHDCWGLHCIHPIKDLFNICLPWTLPQDLPWRLGSALYSPLKRLIQHLFATNTSKRLAMIVGVCTVFILSKTYSTSACQQHFYKTCQDCLGLHCIHLSKTYSISVCKQHSTRLAMTVGVCTVFTFQRLTQYLFVSTFYKACHDYWGLHCIHPFKDLFNICLPPTLPQYLPWLLGSALYLHLKDLFNICLPPSLPQYLPWLLGSALYLNLKDLFNVCLPPTLPQDLPCLLGSALYLYLKDLFNICLSATFLQDLPRLFGSALYTFQKLIQDLFATNTSTRLAMTVGVCTVFTFERLIQHLFATNTSKRLAMIVGVCTVFILSKTLFFFLFIFLFNTNRQHCVLYEWSIDLYSPTVGPECQRWVESTPHVSTR